MARPRPSLESDRLHLLSPSTATSRAASLLSHRSSVVTLKPTQTQTTQPLTKSATAARRFTKSEEEYLDALRAWVEEKQYISLGEDLPGFYGRKTMDMVSRNFSAYKSLSCLFLYGSKGFSLVECIL
jgi:hypothetical protein